jgi:hypothetical protein
VARLPRPPEAAELQARAPLTNAIHPVDADIALWRIHFTLGKHVLAWNQPRRWGPARGRFDPHHLPPGQDRSRSVVYLGDQIPMVLAEVFQHTRRVDVTAGGPWLTGLRLSRTVSLLDLTGLWPTRAGASQAIASGPRPHAQAWARVIADAWPDLDGVWYRSSMQGRGHCAALWAPATDALPHTPILSLPLAHPARWDPLAHACEQLGYRLG